MKWDKLLLIFALIFVAYYFLVAIYIHNYTGFHVIWAMLSIMLTGLYFLMKQPVWNKLTSNKVVNFSVIGLMAAAFIIFIIFETKIIYHANKTIEHEEDIEYMIILGARVEGTTISKALKERLDEAVIYINEHPDLKIIVSGGKGTGEDVTEAYAMKEYLVSNGIDEDRIIQEDKSTTTTENIEFCKKITGKDAHILIVSNGFHIYRAKCLAKGSGYSNVSATGSKTPPRILVNAYVREAVALVKEIIFTENFNVI
ncbi:MAG: YdcF family protein [Lachnospiraceae bacterium]|nr:YdcF family protein [Lachnospiraceae bacterium]